MQNRDATPGRGLFRPADRPGTTTRSLLAARLLRPARWALIPLLLAVASLAAAGLVGGQELTQRPPTPVPTTIATVTAAAAAPPAPAVALPTATPVGLSPLEGSAVAFLATRAALPVAPPPSGLFGPRMGPRATGAAQPAL